MYTLSIAHSASKSYGTRIIKRIGKSAYGSGTGCGYCDLQFSFKTKAQAEKASSLLRRFKHVSSIFIYR